MLIHIHEDGSPANGGYSRVNTTASKPQIPPIPKELIETKTSLLTNKADTITEYIPTNLNDKLYDYFNPVQKRQLNKVATITLTDINKLPTPTQPSQIVEIEELITASEQEIDILLSTTSDTTKQEE